MSSCLWRVVVGMALFGFVATLKVPAVVAKEPTAMTDQTRSKVLIATLHARLHIGIERCRPSFRPGPRMRFGPQGLVVVIIARQVSDSDWPEGKN